MQQDERSLQIWSLLVCAARERRSYTYGELAKALGFKGAGVMANMLGAIMWHCQDHGFPPLTLLVVNQETGRPGEGLELRGDADAERERVFGFDWFAVRPPQLSDFRQARKNHQ